jgi:hypothetical protein
MNTLRVSENEDPKGIRNRTLFRWKMTSNGKYNHLEWGFDLKSFEVESGAENYFAIIFPYSLDNLGLIAPGTGYDPHHFICLNFREIIYDHRPDPVGAVPFR